MNVAHVRHQPWTIVLTARGTRLKGLRSRRVGTRGFGSVVLVGVFVRELQELVLA